MNDFFTRTIDVPISRPVLLLAPMEGITNYMFRECILSVSKPDMVATEFIRITSQNQKVKPFQRHNCPLQIQIMGCSPEIIAGNLAFLKEKQVLLDDDWIDLNVGCPSKKVNAHGSGAALLKEPDKLSAIIRHLRQEHSGPLSIKTRIGFDSTQNFASILSVLKDCPLDFISIHARTRQAGYEPGVNYGQLQLAVATLPFPVIGNGDVWDIEHAEKMLKKTGVRGLMIGRGAVRDPFIFEKLTGHFLGKTTRKVSRPDYIAFSQNLLSKYSSAGMALNKPDKYCGAYKEFAAWLSKNPLLGKTFFDGLKRFNSLAEIEAYISGITENKPAVNMSERKNKEELLQQIA